jgi:hypothetical protein
MLIEACCGESADLRETGARAAGNTIEVHPERAEDLAHPLQVLSARRRKKRSHAAEERTNHLGEPVSAAATHSVHTSHGGYRSGERLQEALESGLRERRRGQRAQHLGGRGACA